MRFAKDARGLNHLWARLFIDELVRLGVKTFCIAPGARSAPLVAALGERTDVTALVHQDERGLGYFALGCARASSKTPPVVITTSGTAVANLVPSAVEGYQTRTPLIIITADRPAELIDTGANQTIRQAELLAECTVWRINLPPPTPDIDPLLLLSTVDLAVTKALHEDTGGPVHLNFQFREPLLFPPSEVGLLHPPVALTRWETSTLPLTATTTTTRTVDGGSCKTTAELIHSAQRGVIVCGFLGSKTERDGVAEIAKNLEWPILADITSGLRFSHNSNQADRIICHYDLFLRDTALKQFFSPDVILHFGGLPVNRTLLAYLTTATHACIQVKVGTDRRDPFGCVTHSLQASPQDLAPLLKPTTSSLLSRLKDADIKTAYIVDDLTSGETLKEWLVVREVVRGCVDGDIVYLGNSLPIRHADTFVGFEAKDIEIACQRGASGIDGTLACAAGFAYERKRHLTLIIGDQTFLHDLSSLQLCRRNMTIVVVNNGGGDIFSYLPALPEVPRFTELFVAPHSVSLAELATGFGLAYETPSTIRELKKALGEARCRQGGTVVEVQTPTGAAIEDLKSAVNRVARALKEQQKSD